MKAYRAGGLVLVGIALVTTMVMRATAGEEPAAAPAAAPTSPTPAKPALAVPATERVNPPPTPVSAAELLKLAQAGVSKEVMQSFIENAPAAIPPSATDIVALKEHGIADDVTLALLKRGADTRARANVNAAALARVLGQRRARFGGLDPESYDYFQYYYLYPRTLSSVYDRLGYYRSPYWW